MKNVATMDALDRRIVSQLQRDASLSNADLAEKVGSTGPSCWRRIRALEEQGVLHGIVRLADPQRLGQSVTIFCHVRMKDFSVDAVKAFEDFVRAHDQVMECHSMSGEWDYLMRVVASDVDDYERFLMRTLLRHPSVAGASSQFALSVTKYETALPVREW